MHHEQYLVLTEIDHVNVRLKYITCDIIQPAWSEDTFSIIAVLLDALSTTVYIHDFDHVMLTSHSAHLATIFREKTLRCVPVPPRIAMQMRQKFGAKTWFYIRPRHTSAV